MRASPQPRRSCWSPFKAATRPAKGSRPAIAASGIDAEIILRDADQKKEALPGFVAEARSLHVDLVMTVGTTATLGMIGTLSDVGSGKYLDDIPVVFTLVADPLGAKIIESYEKTGRGNVTGTYNRVPEAVNLKAMRLIVPNLKKLGLLYNRNERNSMLKLADMQEQAAKLGLRARRTGARPRRKRRPRPAENSGPGRPSWPPKASTSSMSDRARSCASMPTC